MSFVLQNFLKGQLILILFVMACVMCDNSGKNIQYARRSAPAIMQQSLIEKIDNKRINNDQNVKITYQKQMSNSQGDFYYEFQTDNAITTKAAGNIHGISGVLQYVSLEGIPITLTYTADANGYHPSGDHIPKVPDYILRSLEYIRTHAKHVDS